MKKQNLRQQVHEIARGNLFKNVNLPHVVLMTLTLILTLVNKYLLHVKESILYQIKKQVISKT